jgi:diacylglycerol kinase family enzyme
VTGSGFSRPTAAERIAGTVALVSFAAAVLCLVIGALSHWRGVLVALLGLLVVVIAGWYAVSRHGTTRTIAVVVGAAGLAALVIGILTADLSGRRVAGVAALALLSVGAARVALRRSVRAMRRVAAGRTPAPPARHPVLLINPRSGGGKAERFDLVEACRTRGIEPIVLGPGDDLLELAEDAIARGADVIGMAGGDGSQALVASAAIRHGIPHVVVPAGTRNHFALDLGLDRDDVVGALDAYSDGFERRVDVATANGRVFVNNATVGLYAKIVQSPGYREAKRQTAADVLPDLLGPDAAPLDLRFTGPDGAAVDTANVVLVSNDPYQLHMLIGRGTRERLDAGMLGIVALTISGPREFSRFVGLLARGRARRFQGWTEWAAPAFRIDSGAPVEIGVDGEALLMDPPLLFESRPGALRVRTPRHTIGRSPAAAAVHVAARSTLADLARTIAGHPAA